MDTETTGLPDFKAPAEAPHQPHLVQLAWMLIDSESLDRPRVVSGATALIDAIGFEIPPEAAAVHGITTEVARRYGIPLSVALESFGMALGIADVVVAHNVNFDRRIVESACHRAGNRALLATLAEAREAKRLRCTLAENTKAVGALFPDGRVGKWPTLAETYRHYFDAELVGAHDALADVQACAKIFLEMERRKAAAVMP